MKFTKRITDILRKLKTRFVLLLIVPVFVFAGPAMTVQVETEASNTPEPANTTNGTFLPYKRVVCLPPVGEGKAYATSLGHSQGVNLNEVQ